MSSRTLSLQLAALLVSTIAFAQGSASFSQTAEQAYLSAPGNELRVELNIEGQGPLLGVSINQKYLTGQSAQFCRKYTVVASSAQPTYSCFSQSMDEGTAAEVFSQLQVPEASVLFRDANTGSPLLGGSWTEKRQDPGLCVATSPITPEAETTYNCYLRTNEVHGPFGGGVTVGN